MRVLLVLLSVLATAAMRLDAAPATQPSPDEIRKLVQQLGHDEFAAREEAMRRLLQIGNPALDELKKALSTDDPEQKSRAQMLVKRIERHAVPGWDSRFNPDGTLSGKNVQVSVGPDGKKVEVDEGAMHVQIQQAANAITVTVSATENGQRITETYTGKDADDLAQQSPEARELFDRWGGGATPAWILRQGGGQMVVDNGQFNARNLQVLDELGGFRLRLEEQMRKADLPEEKRRMLRDHLEKMQEASAMRNVRPGAAGETEEFLKLCDELRAKLDELKLPDPGATLPPGPKSRLGVAIRQGDPADLPGLMVMEVAQGSRGEKVGLQVGDLIQKVNGRDVATVTDLRKAVIEQKLGTLKLEVAREAKSVELAE